MFNANDVSNRTNIAGKSQGRLGMKVFDAPEHLLRNEHGGPWSEPWLSWLSWL
jgi:hypothetical protein